ncbi:MAG: ferredoxin-thioredoxin reductase catalytic domain-containing protein [bacterium]|nr:ferredoxin-thioredoxin reductase catalytic domain-containing protein [bacterium]
MLPQVSDQEVQEYRQELEKVLNGRGYYLNQDDSYTNILIRGILVNIKRYGYGCCPCRLAAKDKTKDIDVICPCYYRDDDVSEFGACFCGLYVSQIKYKEKTEILSIPERRTKPKPAPRSVTRKELTITHNVWRCNVCGYLSARDTAPDACPICGVPKERFEIFIEGNK